MGSLNFFALWSINNAPRQFIGNSKRSLQVVLPLPLPKYLVVFGLGKWASISSVSVEVQVGGKTQNIGTLSLQNSWSLTWDGDWDPAVVAAEQESRGVYGKIKLKVCKEDNTAIISSTPMVQSKKQQRKRLFPEQQLVDLSQTLDTTLKSPPSHLGGSVCHSELQADGTTQTHDSTLASDQRLTWPRDTTAEIASRGQTMWSLIEGTERGPSPKKTKIFGGTRRKLGEENSEQKQGPSPKKTKIFGGTRRKLGEENSEPEEDSRLEIKKCENRCLMDSLCQQGFPSACPSARWRHGMCLTDHHTAIVIGGETSATSQTHSTDSLWTLDTDNDHWFPMKSSGPIPPPATGHSVTYDPESNLVYVYGGFGEGHRYSDLYILNTLSWKWELVIAAGNIPRLAHHTAVIYNKELYVFGGVQPSRGARSSGLIPSDALYIFNPEFKLWYKPIIEGKPPLSRLGHSMTLLSRKLFVFGGQKTKTYLNDLNVLDLVFMEYTAVKYENHPPLPRSFHAALPVANNRLLISGGSSSIGTLQDVHVFNIDTNMWTSLVASPLCYKPRAGHSLIHLRTSILTDDEKRRRNEKWRKNKLVDIECSVLVFGGSDGGGLYNDALKCHVEIPL